MTNESVIRSTSQAWKFYAFNILSLMSVFVIVVAAVYFPTSKWQTTFLSIFGGLLACIGFFIALSIQCPKCQSRWWKLSLNKPVSSRAHAKLMSMKACPCCDFPQNKSA
ncbi:MAG: hypothetical protein KGM99_19030 [Burkholderiales bacterium]|nr:hypothetical protein [Burkholderiales bacterium]